MRPLKNIKLERAGEREKEEDVRSPASSLAILNDPVKRKRLWLPVCVLAAEIPAQKSDVTEIRNRARARIREISSQRSY